MPKYQGKTILQIHSTRKIFKIKTQKGKTLNKDISVTDIYGANQNNTNFPSKRNEQPIRVQFHQEKQRIHKANLIYKQNTR